MSSRAPSPAVALGGRRGTLGRIALALAIGIPVAGFIAFVIDLAAARYPPSVSLWPVHPLVIIVLMGAGLLVPIVLGALAMATARGRGLGAAAIGVSVLPELLAIGIVAIVIYNAVTP